MSTVRYATVADAHAIVTVHIASWQRAYRGLLPDEVLDTLKEEAFMRRWEEVLADASLTTLVATDDFGRILGFIRHGPTRDADRVADVGEVQALYLHPEVWGQGQGRLLLGTSLGMLRATGYAEASVWVLRDNPRAQRFYEAAGLVPDGVVKETTFLGTTLPEIRRCRRLRESVPYF